MAETLFLIDGHAEIFRSFYAMESLRAPDGRPSGAVFGFARMLRDVEEKFRPSHAAVVFDAPGPTFRHEKYPEYKATRRETPSELREQEPTIEQLVAAHRMPVFRMEGYEADDLIGTLVSQARDRGLEVIIVSGDKDLGQLLRDGVVMYDPRKGETVSAEDFAAKRGAPPERFPDILGLWGDSSDNIPGVPGIGEKGAAKLIGEYGSLEELLDRAEEIRGKRGESLREHAEQARLSKWLATIARDAPVELDADACAIEGHDTDALAAIYDAYGLHSLKAGLGLESDTPVVADRDYRCVADAEAFDAFMKELSEQKHFAFDVETTSTDPMRAELVGMSFSWKEGTGRYLPFRAPDGEATLGDDALRRVAETLRDASVTKTGHNLKYDILVMRRAGADLAGVSFDSMLASHLVDGHIRGHGLDACAKRVLHEETIHIDELIGTGKKQITMDAVPVAQVVDYACEDADIALRLEAALRPRLDEVDDGDLFEKLELPLALVLADMQELGVRLDTALLERMSADMEKTLADLEEKIHEDAGREFNIASPKQLGEILFDELGFPVVRKTKTSRSTDETVLRTLARLDHEKHELPERILLHRMYSKLKSTYVDALPRMVHPETGRIHTTFHQSGTQTGRLSSSDPNLQNIPVRTETGREIRAAFVPEDGWTMLAADYSQVELRVLAHLSGDPFLREAFRQGRDIHRAVAGQVNGVDEADVTPEQRSAAKAVNFGIVYGQTAYGLSQSTGMPQSEAKRFIDNYFSTYRGVKTFLEETIETAREDGCAVTWFKRRRDLPDLSTSNKTRRAAAERMAVNTVVQGTAADLIKYAMIAVHERLRKEKMRSRMLLQIHDELVLECPPEEIDVAEALVREEMETAEEFGVPLVVDTGRGANWLEAK